PYGYHRDLHSLPTDALPIYCGSGMAVTQMSCAHCRVSVNAAFPMSRLGSLPVEHQRFIEMFMLAGGNLKEIAEHVGVSYPTIRSTRKSTRLNYSHYLISQYT